MSEWQHRTDLSKETRQALATADRIVARVKSEEAEKREAAAKATEVVEAEVAFAQLVDLQISLVAAPWRMQRWR